MKHLAFSLFVWIFSALPLILLTSWAEFKKAYILFDIMLDYLDKRSKLVRLIIIAIAVAIMALAVVLLFIKL